MLPISTSSGSILTRSVVADAQDPPRVDVHWSPCYRIIPSRFPTIQLFERVANPNDLDAVFAVESLTNSRLRNEVGELSHAALHDRVTGPGASWIMAPFTHLSSPGGRFSTPYFGAYYTAPDVLTAIVETVYHRQRFLRATNEGPIEVDMRVLHAQLRAELHDIRGQREARPEVYDPNDYGASQRFATGLHGRGSEGVVYDSVRHADGQCAAIFTPRALSKCRQGAHLAYVWDGTRITSCYEKSGLRHV